MSIDTIMVQQDEESSSIENNAHCITQSRQHLNHFLLQNTQFCPGFGLSNFEAFKKRKPASKSDEPDEEDCAKKQIVNSGKKTGDIKYIFLSKSN